MDDYLLYAQCQLFADPGLPAISCISNILAVLFEEIDDLNWCGLYLWDSQKQTCFLGPFQGKTACMAIAVNQGVVGTSAGRRETIVVDDVHEFPGHIPCDSESSSEIVIPVIYGNELLALLDLDSTRIANFSPSLAKTLEKVAALLAPFVKEAHLL